MYDIDCNQLLLVCNSDGIFENVDSFIILNLCSIRVRGGLKSLVRRLLVRVLIDPYGDLDRDCSLLVNGPNYSI